MRKSLLLLMTPGMSLQKWDNAGQLSRELSLYAALCSKMKLNLLIFTYGRNDSDYIKDYPGFSVVEMPAWIPKNIPFRVQNTIYHIFSLIRCKTLFSNVLIAKTNQFKAARFGLLIKFFLKIQLVVRMGFYHSHFKKLTYIERFEERLTFRLADKILTTSSEAADFIITSYDVNPNKVLRIFNSIDTQIFKNMECPKEYDLIYVGRLEKVKNISLLLDVIRETQLKVLIIGKGKLRNEVDKAAKQFKIDWIERVDNNELPIYYNKAHCFILLSAHEGNPKALLEAMACGLPAVGTRVPGIRECIQHGVRGVLVDNNLVDIKNAIAQLFEDRNKIRLMGYSASNWVQQNCDFGKNIDKEVKFYYSEKELVEVQEQY